MRRSLHHPMAKPHLPAGILFKGRPSAALLRGASIRVGSRTRSREFHVTASGGWPCTVNHWPAAPATVWQRTDPERLLERSGH